MIKTQTWITRADVRAQPDTWFVFGDNLQQAGFGGQAREMRGEPNTIGIPTKRAPSMAQSAFFTDADAETVIPLLASRFDQIEALVQKGTTVVFPADGLGTGRAQLATRAPSIAHYIRQRMLRLGILPPEAEGQMATDFEEKQAEREAAALALTALVQGQTPADLERVLGAGGTPSYPPLANAAWVPFEVMRTFPDVIAAATAARIPLVTNAPAPEKTATIQVSSRVSGPVPGTRAYGFTTVTPRPYLTWYALGQRALAQNKPVDLTPMAGYFTQIGKLLTWLIDHEFTCVRIEGPAPGYIQGKGEPAVLPNAGDLVYFMALYPVLGFSVSTQRQTSPINGRVVSVTPKSLTLEEDTANLYGLFQNAADKVARIEKELQLAVRDWERLASWRRTMRQTAGSADLRAQMEGMRKQIGQLQTQISERAVGLVDNAAVRAARAELYGRAPSWAPRDTAMQPGAFVWEQGATGMRPARGQHGFGTIDYEGILLDRLRNDVRNVRLAPKDAHLMDTYKRLVRAYRLAQTMSGEGKPPAALQEAQARVDQLRQELATAVPALRGEAHLGYPSLRPNASETEVQRAAQLMFGGEGKKVEVRAALPPFTSEIAPFDPTQKEELVRLRAESARLTALIEEKTKELERGDALVKELVEPSVSASMLDAMIRATRDVAVEEETPQGTVTITPDALRTMLLDLVGESRALAHTIDSMSYIRPVFHGKIVRTVAVPLTKHGEPLPLEAGIQPGTKVVRGTPLTKVPTLKVREVKPPTPAIRQIAATPVRPRLTKRDAAAIAHLAQPQPELLVKQYLPVGYVALKPGEQGVFAVSRGEDAPLHVNAALLPGGPHFIGDEVQRLGGLGPFLVAYGWMSQAEMLKLPPTLREAETMTPKGAAFLLDRAIGRDDRDVIAWVEGQKALPVLQLSAASEAGPTQIQGADIDPRAQILPLYAAAGKSVPLREVQKITAHVLTQPRPTETAPVLYQRFDFPVVHGNVGDAVAAALNLSERIYKERAVMVALAMNATKKEREELITDADRTAAETRANAFGRSDRDRNYITDRLLREALNEAAEAYPDIRAEVLAKDGFRTSPATQLATVLKKGDPAKYGKQTIEQIVLSFLPDDAQIQEAIHAMQERISVPRVTEDPMFDVLLVAERKPDAGNRPQPSFELLVDRSTRSLRKGQSGAMLGRLIRAFELAPQIGWIPSQYPKSRAEKDALRLAAAARNLSRDAAVAAARLGLDFSEKGDILVGKMKTQGGRGVAVGGGITVEAGKRQGSDAASFGMIGGVRTRSRREQLLQRTPKHELAQITAPLGQRGSYWDQVGAKLKALDAWKAARVQAALAPPPASAATEGGDDPGVVEGSLELLGSLFAGDTTTEPINEDDLFKNPRRLLRNPLNAARMTAFQTFPPHFTLLWERAQRATRAMGTEAANPEDLTGLGLLHGVMVALRHVYSQVPEKELTPAFIRELNEAVTAPDALRALHAGKTLPLKVAGQTFTFPDTFAEDLLAGMAYQRDGARFKPTSPEVILAALVFGPGAGAYLSQHTPTTPELAVLQAQQAKAGDRVQALHDALAVALQDRPPPSAARVLTQGKDGGIAITQAGYILTADSKRWLPSFADERPPEKAASVASLQLGAEAAYRVLVDAIKDPGKADAGKVAAAVEAYNAAVKKLQAFLPSVPSTDADFRAEVAARLFQFLTGRVPFGQLAPSKERRIAALRGDPEVEAAQRISLAGQLDFEGRPLFPIPAETFAALGVKPPDYGQGYTLQSRISLPQVRRVIDQTAARSPLPASTLDCKAGVGRGVAEFRRPYARYTPLTWSQTGIYNAIWLSPDGRFARIYRLGAPVCMFQRHAGESLLEFLGEVAENWHLWLSDPQHKRAAGQVALDIYLGQSGHPTVYRIHSDTDKQPLTRVNLSRRMRVGGVATQGDQLVPQGKATGAITWADAAQVAADAETYLRALRENGLIGEDAFAAAQSVVTQAAKRAPKAPEAETPAAAATYVVLFTPPTADSTTPSEIATQLAPTLLAQPGVELRMFDLAFAGRVREVVCRFLTNNYPPDQMAKARTVIGQSGVGRVLARLVDMEPEEAAHVTLVTGAHAQPGVADLQREMTRNFAGSLTFSAEAGRIRESESGRLLELALSVDAPVIVVEGEDVEYRGVSATSGQALLLKVAEWLAKQGRPATPLVYIYPEVRDNPLFQRSLAKLQAGINQLGGASLHLGTFSAFAQMGLAQFVR